MLLKNISNFFFSSKPHIKLYELKSIGIRTQTNSQPLNTNFNIGTDVPKSMGGQNEYPQPVELFLASLIGCEQATALFVSKQMGVNIQNIEYHIKAERDENAPRYLPLEEIPPVPTRLEKIYGNVIVYADCDEEKIKKIGKIVEQRCPIANMAYLSGCQLQINWLKGKK